jgi:hypothetical protein
MLAESIRTDSRPLMKTKSRKFVNILSFVRSINFKRSIFGSGNHGLVDGLGCGTSLCALENGIGQERGLGFRNAKARER